MIQCTNCGAQMEESANFCPKCGASSNVNSAEFSSTSELGLIRKRALEGDSEAQLELGLRFVNGEGVAQDFSEAFSWYIAGSAVRIPAVAA